MPVGQGCPTRNGRIEEGISRITRVKLQATIEEAIGADLALLGEWSNNIHYRDAEPPKPTCVRYGAAVVLRGSRTALREPRGVIPRGYSPIHSRNAGSANQGRGQQVFTADLTG
jgi:hypothetical protein